jgi:hypothetical protein
LALRTGLNNGLQNVITYPQIVLTGYAKWQLAFSLDRQLAEVIHDGLPFLDLEAGVLPYPRWRHCLRRSFLGAAACSRNAQSEYMRAKTEKA